MVVEKLLKQAGIAKVSVIFAVQIFDNVEMTWKWKPTEIFRVDNDDTANSYSSFLKTIDEIITEYEPYRHNGLAKIGMVYIRQNIDYTLVPFEYIFRFKDYTDLKDKLMHKIKVAKRLATQTSGYSNDISIIIYDLEKEIHFEIPVLPSKIVAIADT